MKNTLWNVFFAIFFFVVKLLSALVHGAALLKASLVFRSKFSRGLLLIAVTFKNKILDRL